jgi:hypothetical protein
MKYITYWIIIAIVILLMLHCYDMYHINITTAIESFRNILFVERNYLLNPILNNRSQISNINGTTLLHNNDAIVPPNVLYHNSESNRYSLPADFHTNREHAVVVPLPEYTDTDENNINKHFVLAKVQGKPRQLKLLY